MSGSCEKADELVEDWVHPRVGLLTTTPKMDVGVGGGAEGGEKMLHLSRMTPAPPPTRPLTPELVLSFAKWTD